MDSPCVRMLQDIGVQFDIYAFTDVILSKVSILKRWHSSELTRQ